MFISFDILLMVNSNHSNGVEVAANCILCIDLLLTSADNCACGEGGTCFTLTANDFYTILKIFNSPTVWVLTNLIPCTHITLSSRTGSASNLGN